MGRMNQLENLNTFQRLITIIVQWIVSKRVTGRKRKGWPKEYKGDEIGRKIHQLEYRGNSPGEGKSD